MKLLTYLTVSIRFKFFLKASLLSFSLDVASLSFSTLFLAICSNGKYFIPISLIPSARSLHSSSETLDNIVRLECRLCRVFMTSCLCRRSRAEFFASLTYEIKSTLFRCSGALALLCNSSTVTSYLKTVRKNINSIK